MKNRIEVEILRNRFDAVAEDMARVIERTSFTTFAKETADFSCGIVATNGEFVAFPWALGATPMLGLNLTPTLARLASPEPGDVYICNDPYLGGPVCTHLPDLNALRPIFIDGELMCWTYVLIHAGDIGGAVPGSVWSTASEVYQEGLRVRPIKLWARDELDEQILALILDNTRIPESNWGDLKALYASLVTGERAVRELVERYGAATIEAGIWSVLDYAEQEAREVFATIPDGMYEFADYLDSDRVSGVPVRIKVRMEVVGSNVTLDFTGTDPQVKSSMNLVTGELTHPFLCQALVAYLVTNNPEIPKCSSILRPITVNAQEGIAINASFPSAMGTRYATAIRVSDTVLGALARACRAQVPAGSSGMLAPVVASVLNPKSGRRSMEVIEPLIGGGGGRPGLDGLDGVEGAFAGYLRNTPVEAVEKQTEVRIKRYCLQPDSGGAGQFRGGLAVRLDIEALRPDTQIIARGLERFRLEPWGLDGGKCGTSGYCRVTRRDGQVEEVGTKGEVLLQPGDIISLCSPAGGGYGDPLQRDPESVAQDLRNFKISSATAESAYGVVVREDGSLSAEMTEELRAERRGQRPTATYDFGPGREQLEARWPSEVQDLCNERINLLPVGIRDWAKHRAFEMWLDAPTSLGSVTDAFEHVWHQVADLLLL